MNERYNFNDIARLPAPSDNVAIATCRLEANSELDHNGESFKLSHTILEGHRFAIKQIPVGEALLSWGLPFGFAISQIQPGEYVCNQKMIDSLSLRHLDFDLPAQPNFRDEIITYHLDEANFQPGTPLSRYDDDRYFEGYRRAGERGVGTRNYIAVMGTTSQTSGFVNALVSRMKDAAADHENIDGVIAVAHTEGGEGRTPNNLDMLLRTLAGFMIHPNVGAVLAVDYGSEAVTNRMLQDYLIKQGYPLDHVKHHFLSIRGGFDANLENGSAILRGWMDPVNAMKRTKQPLSNIKIALQCGGSDAFSGVSGNPLAAYVAKEVIRYGGAANLAETDELMGAEHYVLQNVKDLETASKFLDTIERFKERASWHGHSAEGNPSGGNNFRGLYNIAIKSIGAAMKRNPDVCLDHVIDYSELMSEPGYYFMDSPGNDLESIAGQVASGANMIFFVTGNGSITNFPFVPTIKIVTTTDRYNMLEKDMDVNAGAYLDGTSMEVLGEETLDLMIDVASGERSVGERAGHSQVSLWRDWKQTGPTDLDSVAAVSEMRDGTSIPVKVNAQAGSHTFRALEVGDSHRSDQIGLILPTSLCSGQIAQMIANRLNDRELGRNKGISRYVALAHTEGCGVSSGQTEEIYTRTLVGHLTHPTVGVGLLLEHGCEKTHNDHVLHALETHGIDSSRYGWASIQLDGGIEAVTQKVERWFEDALESMPAPRHADAGLEHLRLGLTSAGKVTERVALSLARLTQEIAGAGGTVVAPANATFLTSPAYVEAVVEDRELRNTLAYGQAVGGAGLHIMETPTDHPVETLTGLGATGVDLVLAHIVGHPLQSHRMIPLVQVTTDETTGSIYEEDLDVEPSSDDWSPESFSSQMLDVILHVASRQYTPKLYGKGNTDFQFTRGLLGLSM